ncbi:MAG TPA: 50S ribosomal protein L19 [Planctomycetota bacterium]|nr:50S ribosomal protein L19 [Planctomycetota bacterium]
MNLVERLERQQMKADLPEFEIGDTVDVHVQIVEGDKERIQVFNGTVIGRKGGGINQAFTVRRIVQGEGVERTFPIHSPKVVKIVVKRKGHVRRAKLLYLRDRVGKSTRVRERKLETTQKPEAAE